jgi:hypothetical protein
MFVSLQDALDFKDVIINVWMSCLCDLCTNAICCIIIHSYVVYVVKFNVSSTNINAHARLSRYVWYGFYKSLVSLINN